MSNHLPTPYQQFIHKSRYARWLPEQNRRETWEETVSRYFNFFDEYLQENNNFTVSKQDRKALEEAVLDLRIMPSMRCLMTAGEALKRENVASYNCSYVAVDSPRSFDEILYILMNGTGVGFSVEQKFTDQLPIVSDDFHETDTTIHVADSKLGWAKALKEIVHLLYGGQIPRWDVSKVRPAGAPLKTFGGRASGPEPLVDLFKFCVATFKKAAGRKLTSLECHDIICKIAEIVVVGGVRRSALISLSDLSDDRMRVAKSGDWWKENVQRALANNSFVAKEKPDVGIFMREWLSLYESRSGERGIFSREASKAQAEKFGRRDPNHDFGTNPCCLVGSSTITTRDHGIITIKEVVELHNNNIRVCVLAFDTQTENVEWVPVDAAQMTRPNAELIELEIDTIRGAKTLCCTPDHPIFTNNRGYVRADELTEDDDLVISI
jgi:ribonucleoside-diphosphate reductase alpha chain